MTASVRPCVAGPIARIRDRPDPYEGGCKEIGRWHYGHRLSVVILMIWRLILEVLVL